MFFSSHFVFLFFLSANQLRRPIPLRGNADTVVLQNLAEARLALEAVVRAVVEGTAHGATHGVRARNGRARSDVDILVRRARLLDGGKVLAGLALDALHDVRDDGVDAEVAVAVSEAAAVNLGALVPLVAGLADGARVLRRAGRAVINRIAVDAVAGQALKIELVAHVALVALANVRRGALCALVDAVRVVGLDGANGEQRGGGEDEQAQGLLGDGSHGAMMSSDGMGRAYLAKA